MIDQKLLDELSAAKSELKQACEAVDKHRAEGPLLNEAMRKAQDRMEAAIDAVTEAA